MRKILSLAALLGLAACTDASTTSGPAGPSLAPMVARSSSSEPIPNRYIVRFRDNEPDAAGRAKSIERSHGAIVEHVYTTVIKGASMQLNDAAAAALRSDRNVMLVEQDQTIHSSATQANPVWGLDRIDQNNRPYSNSYTYNATGAGVTVYILDTGLNFTHTEYNGRAFAGIDEVTTNGTATDCAGHGSHVGGTIGGNTYGVAKGVTLVAVRVLDCSGNGTLAGVIAGIDWVTQHAVKPAVANMSLGGGFSSSLNAAVQGSVAAGITYVVAAGNSAGNACNESPSSEPSAITVAASDINDVFANFSNYGSCVDIIAPGVGITSAWIGSNTATNTISGTSMATPHVVGAAALYLQGNPTATPAQVAAALTGNATNTVISSVPSGTPNKLLYTGFIGGVTPPGNQPPVAHYTWTCVGQSVPNQCAFDGSSSTDDHGIVTYAWNWGNGRGESHATPTVRNAFSPGVYTVTLTVTDGGGLSSSTSHQVTVGAAPANQPPSASIASPANGTSVVQGTSLTFSGSGTDPEDGALNGTSLAWTSSRDGALGIGGPFNRSDLSVGTHLITLTATDSKGATGTSTVTVTITAPPVNQPPTASITAPGNNASVVQGTSITFTGSGADPEDGALAGASLVWTSSMDGVIGTGTSFSKSTLSVGTHTITLTSTDSKGATGTATITVTVTAAPPVNQPPVASFTWTCTGQANPHQCVLDGSGSTDDHGIVSWTWNWGNGRAAETKTVSTARNTWAAPGTYQVTLTVKDASGLTGTVTQSVIVP